MEISLLMTDDGIQPMTAFAILLFTWNITMLVFGFLSVPQFVAFLCC